MRLSYLCWWENKTSVAAGYLEWYFFPYCEYIGTSFLNISVHIYSITQVSSVVLTLQSINVMDYSLLVGVDKQRRELVFGIIDYLRQYTWDKQLETWVKTSLVVPKNALPTVISPKEYKKRFRNFMTKYFLTVPDTWCQEKCSGPCRFCSDSCRNASFSESVKLPERWTENSQFSQAYFIVKLFSFSFLFSWLCEDSV